MQTSSIQLKIISVRETRKVQHWTFSENEARPNTIHRNTVAAVSDGKMAFKFILFKELASQIEEGKTYIFKNYSISKFANDSLLCIKYTKIYMCAALRVPEELEEEAKLLIRPPSLSVALSGACTQTDKHLTVEGTVTRIMGLDEHHELSVIHFHHAREKTDVSTADMSNSLQLTSKLSRCLDALDPIQKVFPPHGLPYPVQCLFLKKADTESKIILWREANIAILEVGMPLRLSHMRAKNVPPYGMALHSTSYTEVQPFSGLIDIKVIGVRMCEEGIELLDSDDTPRPIGEGVWAATFTKPAVTAVGKMITLCFADGRVQEVFSAED